MGRWGRGGRRGRRAVDMVIKEQQGDHCFVAAAQCLVLTVGVTHEPTHVIKLHKITYTHVDVI